MYRLMGLYRLDGWIPNAQNLEETILTEDNGHLEKDHLEEVYDDSYGCMIDRIREILTLLRDDMISQTPEMMKWDSAKRDSLGVETSRSVLALDFQLWRHPRPCP